ncbi:MAG: polysaccharide deacetylase family protein [Sulfuricurvum sp.]|jgi:peptidoglycan/xylan/chitin deacetylase (PgdA/CDA1 family)|uniref:polysaccharide deacetylase family protein n=1 Tax=Sulfuricurvum sp. TaxID=2025608 RepID=UPI0025E77274|nr:polysaccharide deacetylase family protein [Sulfuricurvum sp.]MCK9372178.1 polysaccharide deacetylase family protein [Sulfuricurvum sp.]
MNTSFFFLFLLLFHSLLFGDTRTIYDIRGASPILDANLTRFLDVWRADTITPIQNGTYSDVIVNGNPERKTIALTFDDSPDENVTNEVLDVLQEHKVQATFFMIGSPMTDINATTVQRASREGHLVLNHSFTHPRFTKLSDEEVFQELNASSSRIQELTGHYPLLIRPPYGSINASVVRTINTHGFTAVLWSLDSLDWAIKEKDPIVENVLTHIRPGDIILMHSGRSNHPTAEALPEIIEKLQQEGYTFVTLSQLMGIAAYR